MWTMRGRLWVPKHRQEIELTTDATSQGKTRKVSLSTVTPERIVAAISLIAAFIAWQEVRVSERAMRVGQRAYLAIEQGQLRAVAEYSDIPNEPQWLGPDGAPIATRRLEKPVPTGIVTVHIAFNVVNLGNTPASSIRGRLQLKTPRGWTSSDLATTKQDAGGFVLADVGAVGPKASLRLVRAFATRAEVENLRWFLDTRTRGTLPDAGNVVSRKLLIQDYVLGSLEPIQVRGTLQYSDVFGELHTETWCWMDAGNTPYPWPCPDALARAEVDSSWEDLPLK